MNRILLTLCLVLVVLAIGCQPTKETASPEPSATKSTESKPKTSQDPDWPYSQEQIEEARKLATELGAKINFDSQGNIILLDMAKNRTWANDSQMEEILILPKLKMLVVEGPGITDMLFARIVETPSLTSLTMKNTLISDEGVAQLVALKNLNVIDLRQSPMLTDEAMKSLAKIPSLKAVRLVDTQITDTGIATLSTLPNLTELDLRYCQNITTEGLEKLAETKSLKTLLLGGDKVTNEAINQLKKSLPECKIQVQ